MITTNPRPVAVSLLTAMLCTGMVVLLGSGCGGEHRLTTTGTLLVDGKPAMEGVRVFFSPMGNTRPADGFVTADGTFNLKSMNKLGVMPGDYKIVLINSTNSIPKPTSEFKPVNGDPPGDWFAYQAAVTKFLDNPPVGPGWIPKSYANVGQTPLRWSVPKDGLKAKFEIESTPVKSGGAAK